ncbi:MarR family winged helix-turn-helix transcriptional regulator [Patulibacter sp. S7RM1-6]
MRPDHEQLDALAGALYGLSALRRDLQRRAGLEHASAALQVLGVVKRYGPARISDVASELQVSLSVASRQVQALEDEGLVDRVADPHDGRSSLVALSDAGRAKLDAIHGRFVRSLGEAIPDWTADEVDGLAAGLRRLRNQLAHTTCTTPTRAATPEAAADRPDRDPRAGNEENSR